MGRHIIFYTIIIASLMFSCSYHASMKRANALCKSGRSNAACEKYEDAYRLIKSGKKTKEIKADLAEKIGDLYSLINRQNNAYRWYVKSLNSKSNLKERYRKLVYLSHYLGKVDKENMYSKKSNIVYDSTSLIFDYQRYSVKLFKEINTRYDDFCPVFRGLDTTEIYFSSNRNIGNKSKLNDVTGSYYCDIYRTRFSDEIIESDYPDKYKKSNKKKFLKEFKWIPPIHLSDKVNGSLDEGTLTFEGNGGVMYFASSEKLLKENKGVKIYRIENNGSGWENRSMLNIVDDSISVGQPAYDKARDRLYFVSSMTGGYGGSDIWYVDKIGNDWTKPKNAGNIINTEGNEKFPYIRDNGDFYFSSDMHRGYGGLDIFRFYLGEDNKKCIENLGLPINSRADDFGIVFKPRSLDGYFSSSRGKRGKDNIYSFVYTPMIFNLELELLDRELETPIVAAKVKMIDNNGSQNIFESDSEGRLHLEWQGVGRYLFLIGKKMYLNSKVEINTEENEESEIFKRTIYLAKTDQTIELPNVFYEIGKAELTSDSEKSLKILVEVLNDNPNITIELSAHTDMIGNSISNQLLSQRRAQLVVEFLKASGIASDRLFSKGYGESMPKRVSIKESKLYPFLNENTILNEIFINKKNKEQQEICNQLNRRTEFKVLRKDYVPIKFRK